MKHANTCDTGYKSNYWLKTGYQFFFFAAGFQSGDKAPELNQ